MHIRRILSTSIFTNILNENVRSFQLIVIKFCAILFIPEKLYYSQGRLTNEFFADEVPSNSNML